MTRIRFILAIQQQQVTARYGVIKLLGKHCHLIGRDRRLNLHLKKWVLAQVPQKLLHLCRRHGGSQEEHNCPMELIVSAAGGTTKFKGQSDDGNEVRALRRRPCM